DLVSTDCIRLSDYKGKVVVLSFWGFWCPHCRKMFPYERDLVRREAGKPFELIGVNSDKDPELIKRELVGNQITWRSFKNQRSEGDPVSKLYSVKGWPTVYVIDHKGVIRQKWVGRPDEIALEKMIDQLVSEAEKDAKKK